MSVISKDTIEREAREAARRGQSLDEACPYPFGSDAAHHFRAVWLLARTPPARDAATIQAPTAQEA